MISVIIATADSERALVPTLSALVPGAMAGVIREVIVADAGSRDATATIADAAGCRFFSVAGTPGSRLKAGADAARGSWLMFLQPGAVLEAAWIDEVDRFIHDVEIDGDARPAVFRRARRRSALTAAEAFTLLAAALGARPRPEQGLLLMKRHYEAVGGHRPDSADPETDLLRRLGRRRIVLLHSSLKMAA